MEQIHPNPREFPKSLAGIFLWAHLSTIYITININNCVFQYERVRVIIKSRIIKGPKFSALMIFVTEDFILWSGWQTWQYNYIDLVAIWCASFATASTSFAALQIVIFITFNANQCELLSSTSTFKKCKNASNSAAAEFIDQIIQNGSELH